MKGRTDERKIRKIREKIKNRFKTGQIKCRTDER